MTIGLTRIPLYLGCGNLHVISFNTIMDISGNLLALLLIFTGICFGFFAGTDSSGWLLTISLFSEKHFVQW